MDALALFSCTGRQAAERQQGLGKLRCQGNLAVYKGKELNVSQRTNKNPEPLFGRSVKKVLLPVAFFQMCLYVMFMDQVQSWVRKKAAVLNLL